ncbi:oligosaccharide flippase family protein [Sphingobium phenoxybenzoativorans]|uniref:Oligosaccharide flippase family protein n=1 Tax=Sphingobium phenoxybenzoativorans TaxID=1592790 RepID=A0A975K7T0_9SPHN|nr:oligosaccharide flippase family protein [Sphingobium phenoxybenzoativorans]QUT05658.1 oligosaccharide flippase family protein [Sphingobium phenoxybenzoativorans]
MSAINIRKWPDLIKRAVRSHSKFIHDIMVYGLGQVALKGLDVVAFAILVRQLPVEALGFVGTMTLVGFLITDVLTLGIPRIGVPRYIADQEETNGQESRNIIASGNTFCIMYTLIISIIVFIIPRNLYASIGLGASLLAFQFYIVAFAIRALVYMQLEILRMQQRARLQAFLEATPSVLNCLLLWSLISAPLPLDKPAISGLCQLLGWAPLFVYTAVTLGKSNGLSVQYLGPLTKYSLPLVVHRSMGELNGMSGRWIVAFMFGMGAAGIYTFLSRIGDILKIALMPVQKAWLPALFKSARQGKDRSTGQMAIIYMLLSTGAYFAMLLIYSYIANIIDKNNTYSASYHLIPIMLMTGWLTSFYSIFGVGFFVAKKSSMIIPITTITTLITIVISVVLGKIGGLSAMPYGAALGSIFFVVSTQYFARRYYTIRYRPTWLVAGLCLLTGVTASVLITEVFN